MVQDRVQDQVQDQIQEALVDVAAEEAQQEGGTLKVLRDVTSELEGLIPKGEGTMKLMSSAGKLSVWNRHSGRQSNILTDQLRFQLRKRFPANHPMAGQRVYSLKPVEVPAGTKLKCWLHPEHEKRPWLDGIGLAGKTCLSDSIPTEYAARVHMRRKHTTAYDLIQDVQAREERRKDREVRQQQLEALQTMAKGQGGPAPEIYHCRIENCNRFFDSESGRNQHEYSHKKDNDARGED